jgi:hypothetical protein
MELLGRSTKIICPVRIGGFYQLLLKRDVTRLTWVNGMDANVKQFEVELAAREPGQQGPKLKLHRKARVVKLARL